MTLLKQDYLLVLFLFALFLSALLLFSVQPLFAKMALPFYGGSAGVWSTCLVFFQLVLMAGYFYADRLTRLRFSRQFLIHAVCLLASLAFLPLKIPANGIPAEASYPVFSLLKLLFLKVGLPFFVLAATAPLLQVWFSSSWHPSAKDPYFLYVASNSGSLAALLGYLVVIEPHLTLEEQSRFWAWGFVVWILLLLGCAFASSSQKRVKRDVAFVADQEEKISLTRKWRWLALSFVPSSLMLGVTTFLGTNLSSVPLLWIIPLALYLLSFILMFVKRPLFSSRAAARTFPFFLIPLIMFMAMKMIRPLGPIFFLHLAAFFIAALFCHGELAKDRPLARDLTLFYLLISAGGALGGLFNVLAAPFLFRDAAEYPLALVLACMLRPDRKGETKKPGISRNDFLFPLLIAVSVLGLFVIDRLLPADTFFFKISGYTDIRKKVLLCAIPALMCFIPRNRSLRFGLCVGAFFYVHALLAGNFLTERSFFGVHKIVREGDTGLRALVHGQTMHGIQDPLRRKEPLSYYHPTGPAGEIVGAFQKRGPGGRVAVIGLGIGSLAAYGRSGEHWHFYEIDPAVKKIATNPSQFTFIADSAAEIEIFLADGRLGLRQTNDRSYDLIVVDAFSSDSVPVHLLTREALDLYFSKLSEGGLIAFHTSNLFLNIDRVLSSLAKLEGHACKIRRDFHIEKSLDTRGKKASVWMVLSRREEDLRSIDEAVRWGSCTYFSKSTSWTDDYSNILSVVRWRS